MSGSEQERYIALKEMLRSPGWSHFCAMLKEREQNKVVDFMNCERFDLERIQGEMVELSNISYIVTRFIDEYETSRKEEKENV